ncbi:MAG: nitrophenyl compound nitroreductase subunit ArsF family protein [Candidatus Zixiibacteriota bacterium]
MNKHLKMSAMSAAITLLWIGGWLIARAGETPRDEAAVEASRADTGDSTVAPHKVVAYYFHGNVRCATCRKIEAYTKEAIDSAFTAELERGDLEWRVVNTDQDSNKHYIEEYLLYTRSVVLADIHNGEQTRWTNLDKVWLLSGAKAKFTEYIQSEVRLFLDPAK